MGKRRNATVLPGFPVLGAEALGNFSNFNDFDPATQTQSAANSVALAAVAIRIKFSNTVRFDCSMSYGGNTNTEVIHLQLQASIFAPPVATPLFAAVGTGTIDSTHINPGLDSSQDSFNRAHFGAVLTSDAAGDPANSFQFNGASLTNGVILAEKQAEVITGTLQGGQLTLAAGGLFSNALLVPGAWVALTIVLLSNTDGDTVTFEVGCMSIQEQPLGARFGGQ